jgi:TonB family protein
MFNEPKGKNPAWMTWLVSLEADELIGSEAALFEYFTDEEFVARKLHCDLASNDCRMPAMKNARIPSTAVRQPEFELPTQLPPGLADAVVRGSGCRGGWFGVAAATADRAGRVMRTSIQRIAMDDRCATAVDELMKLSFATPDSIVSPSETKDILLVQARSGSLCLDETPVSETDLGLRQAGGEVKAPILKRRVEPHFPESALRRMGRGTDVNVIVQCVVSRNGCIRSIRLIAQSPFPELNGAALEAISEWQFIPGQLRGIPVDTVFNLTIHFKT